MASMGSTKTVFPSKLFLFTGRKDKGTKWLEGLVSH